MSLQSVLDRLSTDPDHVMAGAVRWDIITRATSPFERAALAERMDFQNDHLRGRLVSCAASHDEVDELGSRPDFQSEPVQRKVVEAHAWLDAVHADAEDRLLGVVASGSKKAQMKLLERARLPAAVVTALGEHGATRAIRNVARHWSRRRTD